MDLPLATPHSRKKVNSTESSIKATVPGATAYETGHRDAEPRRQAASQAEGRGCRPCPALLPLTAGTHIPGAHNQGSISPRRGMDLPAASAREAN